MINKRKLNIRIFGLVLIGTVLIVSLIRFSDTRKTYFINNNDIQAQLDKIGHKELKLNTTILQSTIFIYSNNDKIEESIKELNFSINKLLKNSYFKEYHPLLYKQMLVYKEEIDKKIDLIYEFNTLNSAIKNSSSYFLYIMGELPSIRKKYQKEFNFHYVEEFMKTVSNIFLSKASLKNFIDPKRIDFFSHLDIKEEGFKKLNKTIVAHLNMINKKFPVYKKLINHIVKSKSIGDLNSMNKEFFQQNTIEIKKIDYIFYAIVFFIVIYTIFIVILYLQLYKENETLNSLTLKLDKAIKTDILTDLYSRYKYEKDILLETKYVLFLINVNKFKSINEYYGTKMGDFVLRCVAQTLKEIIPVKFNAQIYRLGADDFGILIKQDNITNYNQLAELITTWFETHECEKKGIKFKLSVTIGISEARPYFEKSDIALSKAKKSIKLKYLKYKNEFDKLEEIEKNIKKTQTLYKAIKDDRIIPYFQPIVDIHTKKIVKYEALARVAHKDGRIESIYPYLQIAKDNKLYFEITKSMLSKSISICHAKKINFNINFSVEDIIDENILSLLNDMNKKYPGIFSQITFELLESEAVTDYNAVKNFIEFAKNNGATIAIDDFGSGYSNFEHLLNLNIDYLKIDGSLIKNIDKDKNARRIVSLISKFAKESGIRTVAEYIENESIHKVLKELNLDFGQGYLFSKPIKLD